MLKAENKMPVTFDSASGRLDLTPARLPLKTIDDVRLEMAKVYCEMKDGSRKVNGKLTKRNPR